MTDQVTVDEEAWSANDEGDLLVRLYRPRKSHLPPPVILDVHGGAWSSSDRTAGEQYDAALAAAGFAVAAIDFHQGPTYQHPSASRDVVGAVRWLRMNAPRLAINADSVGLLGSSSGGHLVMYAGVLPGVEYHQGAKLYSGRDLVDPGEDVSAEVQFIMALWPVSDPYFRYRYAKRARMERLVQAHDGFYVTEDAMRAASVPRLVVAGEAQVLPPLLIVQPGEDANVPIEMTFDLLRAWQSRDGYVEYSYFPDQPHGFGHRDSVATQHMNALLIDFARRHGMVSL